MNTKEDNDYVICFRYIIFAMKMLAVFPFLPLHEVFGMSHLFSMLLTIISVLLYAWVNLEEQTHLYHSFFDMLENFSFVHLLSFLPGAFSKILLLCLSCLTWNKNKDLRNYHNNWKHFQIEMEKLTRSSFKCSIKHKIRGISVFGMILISGIAVLIKTHQRKSSRSPTSLLSGLYFLNGTANMMIYWVFNNMYIISSTKQLTKLVQRSINKNRDIDLRRFIDLWMTLCDLNKQFIDSHSILFLLLFSSTILNGVIGVFCTVYLFIYSSDKSLSFTYLIATVICMLSVMIFCESANSVTKYMVYELRRILLVEHLRNKNERLLQMIVLFLQTIETKDPQITFSGYMTIDRSILSSVLGTAIYFLVVLKQFSPF